MKCAPPNKIPQVRVIINTYCGKHCKYCRPSGESSLQSREGDYDLLRNASAVLLRQGHKEFRLTGGDPLLSSISDLCSYISFLKDNGASNVSLVTRYGKGRSFFSELRKAGLDSISFSIDSLDTTQWLDYCGLSDDKGHEHAELLCAAEEAHLHGFSVSINCVVLNTTSDDEVDRLLEFASRCKASLKLEEMIRDIGPQGENLHRSLDSIVDLFRRRAISEEIIYAPGGLGHPMVCFKMGNGGAVLFKQLTAGAWYSPTCQKCTHFPCDDALMALRLQPTGALQVCLKRNDNLHSLGESLLNGSMAEAESLAVEALDYFRSAEYFTADEIENIRHQRLLSDKNGGEA